MDQNAMERRVAQLERDHAVTRQQIDDHLSSCDHRYEQFGRDLGDTKDYIRTVSGNVATLQTNMHNEFKSIRKSHAGILIVLVSGLLGLIAAILASGIA